MALTAAEVRPDAQEGRIVTFAIPRDVPRELIAAVVAYVLAPFVSLGMSVYADIETAEASDGLSNSHAHVLISLRAIGKSGFELKDREWNRYFWRDGGRYFRAVVAGRLTLACCLIGLRVHLDPRSNEARGLGPPESRLPAAYWKRRQKGEAVKQIE